LQKIVLFGTKNFVKPKFTEKNGKRTEKEQKKTEKNRQDGEKCEGQQNKNYLHCYTVPLMLYIYFIFLSPPTSAKYNKKISMFK